MPNQRQLIEERWGGSPPNIAPRQAGGIPQYLKKRRAYMRYGEALAAGHPIASGVIEGACHHLVRDRLDCCGARWDVNGAEAVLKLRALASSGDFDDYWAFHLRGEHPRNHVALYANATIPTPIPMPRIRRVK